MKKAIDIIWTKITREYTLKPMEINTLSMKMETKYILIKMETLPSMKWSQVIFG